MLRLWSLLAALAVFAFSGVAHAAEGVREMSQYRFQQWGIAQGLPGVVHAIAQTPDGYLWIGTDAGLLRFDGLSFTPMEPQDPELGQIHRVLALAVDGRGVLWIWLQGTHVLQYQNGVFTDAEQAAPNQPGVTAIAHGGGGILLATNNRRIVRVTGTDRTELGNAPSPLLLSLAQTSDGRVWLGTRESGLFYLEGRNPFPIGGHLPDLKINCLFAAGNERMWIGTDSGLALWDGAHLSAKPFPAPLDHAQIFSLVEDSAGNLWAGTANGLVRYNGKTADIFKNPGFSTEPVTALFEDREGNLWAGDTHGIERIANSAFTTWSSSEGLPGNAYGPVFADSGGRTWFAPLHGGLAWLRDGEVHRVTVAGLDSDIVYSIDGDKENLWLGRQRGGLTRLHLQDGVVVPETFKLGPDNHRPVVYAVHVNRDGSVWLGTLTAGALHLVGGAVTSFTTKDGLPSDSVSAIEEGANGAMWFGTPDNGVGILAGNRWRRYSTGQGLPSPDVTCLFEDRQGILWVGTSGGLAYIAHGIVKSAAQQNTPLHERILGIAEDRSGSLWISTSSHIVQTNRDSILHGTPVLREYDTADGLRGIGGVRRNRSLVADPAGRIWISTTNGLSFVDPAAPASRASTATAHIESVLIDGRSTGSNPVLAVTTAGKRLAFNYTAFNFAAPEKVRFRYRLDGFDRDWSDPIPDREAVYTNLSPGSYRFRVMASSNGDWSTPDAFVSFRVAPRFWQTWWFILLCVLCVALVCILLYQLRIQQVVRSANRRFEERLAERTRIAQELHDTLLQGFFSASMQLHVITDSVPANSLARPHLDRVLALIGRVLDEGRNAVRGLRSNGEQSIWIEEALGVMLRDLGGQEDVYHVVHVDGISRQLRPGVQDEIVRIASEALGNAFRHAQAQNIEVEVRYGARNLSVEVRDDGQGIQPEVLAHGREGHWGLPGMRERAESIGGRLVIANRATGGVRVTLTVPGHIAYLRSFSSAPINWIVKRFRALSTRSKSTDRGLDKVTRD